MKEKEAESAIVALGSAGYPFVTVIVTYFSRFDLVKFALEGLESQDYPQCLQSGMRVIHASLITFLWTIRSKYANGKYILFMDDDNIAKPWEISMFVTAMEKSNADVLTSFVDFFWGKCVIISFEKYST